MHQKFVRLPDVMKRYGLCKSAVYALVARQEFPGPIHIGRATRWNIEELDAFDEAKAAERLGPTRVSSTLQAA